MSEINGNVYMTCPHCGKETIVIAKAYETTRLDAAVIVDKRFDVSGRPIIDWENAVIEANFHYVCDHCDGVLVSDLDTLYEMMRKGEQGIHVC